MLKPRVWSLLALAGGLILTGCTAKVVDEGQMPQYEQTREGEAPKVDVEPADVQVETKKVEVTVPTDVDLVPSKDGVPDMKTVPADGAKTDDGAAKTDDDKADAGH